MNIREPEGDFYEQIIRRAKRARERAAESLRRSRGGRTKQADTSRRTEVVSRPRQLHGQD